MYRTDENPLSVLQHYWHYNTFREGQLEIVQAILSRKDVMAILPTGGGKSVCYQVPAMILEGITIVVSPLISLMQDQIARLHTYGIPAQALLSGMAHDQLLTVLHAAAAGSIKLLYLAPERLHTALLQEFLPRMKVSLIAVDEAHCISQWGHDFRPDYLSVYELRGWFPEVPVAAFTASATPQVQDDIMHFLKMRTPLVYRKSVIRPNLSYSVRYAEDKPLGMLQQVQAEPGSGILYCRSRKNTVVYADLLQHNHMTAYYYHAGMERPRRDAAQAGWMGGKNALMVATTAFGMGIDKPDVRAVYHMDVPYSLEEYYQEAGRAGRDGLPARAVLFCGPGDEDKLWQSVDAHFPDWSFIRQVYNLVGIYLKIPLGSGNEECCPFQALAFCTKYRLPVIQTYSTIKLLEREGLWQWQEDMSTRSIVWFTTDRETIDYFAGVEPRLYVLINALLRSYGSIFNFSTAIDEYGQAKMLGWQYKDVVAALLRLQAFGVLVYRPAFRGSALIWEHDRVAPEFLQIDLQKMKRLRASYTGKIKAMVGYLNNREECRSVLLARYFGEQEAAPCGVCDICRKKAFTGTDWTRVIYDFLQKQEACFIKDIYDILPENMEDAALEILRNGEKSGLCTIDVLNRMVYWKGK